MKVLKIKKMPKGKYKLTFDNGSDMVLYEEVIIKNIILIGKEIDADLQKKIFADSYKANPYHQALQYINTRMRSREELREYLIKKENEEDVVNETISKLEKEGYINDEEFAKAYIADKLNLSNDGINKIKRSLGNYKVKEEIIDKLLLNIDDQKISDKLDKLISKQISHNTKYTGNILKNRILNYLVNLGYDSSLILEKLNNQEFKNNNNIQSEYQKLSKKYSKKYSGYKLDMTIKQHLFQKGYDALDIESIIK